MSSKNGQKTDYSKKILKILGKKPVISLDSLKEEIKEKFISTQTSEDSKNSYALTRSVKNLVEAGFAKLHKSDNQNYVRITDRGKAKLNNIRLVGDDALVSQNWDGFWRIIILDIGEERKNERESLRYLLKKANFVCVKNTVWISPFPYEHLFTNIKKDLNLTTELMIVVTEKLDPETNLAFLEATKNKAK